MTMLKQDVLRDSALVAQQAALRLEHPWIGAEHLLFAVCAADDGTGLTLNRAGLSPRQVWNGIRELVGVGRWAVDRDALAALGIQIDDVLAAVSGPTNISAKRSSRRRRTGHLPINAVAARCLTTAATDGRTGTGRLSADRARLALARAVIDANSRTVTLLLRKAEVDDVQLRAALRSNL